MVSFLFICKDYQKYTEHKKNESCLQEAYSLVRAQNVYT